MPSPRRKRHDSRAYSALPVVVVASDNDDDKEDAHDHRDQRKETLLKSQVSGVSDASSLLQYAHLLNDTSSDDEELFPSKMVGDITGLKLKVKRYVKRHYKALSLTVFPLVMLFILYISIRFSGVAKARTADKKEFVPECKSRCYDKEICIWTDGCILGPGSCSRCELKGTLGAPYTTLSECELQCPNLYPQIANNSSCVEVVQKTTPSATSLANNEKARAYDDGNTGNYICSISEGITSRTVTV